jgi:hypothetical protein
MVVIEKYQRPYRESNLRPSELQRIASANCASKTDSKLAAVERATVQVTKQSLQQT